MNSDNRERITLSLASVEEAAGELYQLKAAGIFVRRDHPPTVGTPILLEVRGPAGETLGTAQCEVVRSKIALSPGGWQHF